MRKRKLQTGALLLLLSCLTACKKLLNVEPPINQVEQELVFSSEETANAALAGLYSKMMPNLVLSHGALSVHGGLSADELLQTGTNSDFDAYAKNALTPTTTSVAGRFWSHAYPVIHHINRIIEGLHQSTALSPDVRRQFLGEAYFTRAYYYYYLANLFGAVPLVLRTDYVTTASLPRTPETEVYQQVLTDLLEAEQNLSPAVVNGGIRPSKMAATGLLARVYLQRKEWDKAEQKTSAVLTSTAYSLEPVTNVFLATSKEVIWQIKPPPSNFNTSEGLTFITATATTRPAFILQPSLLAAFETGDNRKTHWTKSVTLSGTTYTYPFKYKVGSNATTTTEYNIQMRLSEQYLIRAEARAALGHLADARNDLNTVRARAGLAHTNAVTPAEVLAAIRNERRIEFFAELGFRWLDLKRWDLATPVLSPLKAGWQPTDVLYPIPQSQIDRNPFLNQNPGY